MAITTMRNELIKLYNMLVEEFPDCIRYYNELESLKDNVSKSKRYPISWFISDILNRYNFQLTYDSLMEHSMQDESRTITNYEYESDSFPGISIEIKSLKYTDKLKEKLKGKKYRLSISPSGNSKQINIYSLWYDDHHGEYIREYYTQNEILFCQYLLNRNHVIKLMKSCNLKTKDNSLFTRGDITVNCLSGMRRFTIEVENETIFKGSLSELNIALSVIKENKMFDKDYDDFCKNKKVRKFFDL